MSAPVSALRTYDHGALALWQACPRRFWFQEVERARPDPVLVSFSEPLRLAGQAGVGMVLLQPDAGRGELRRHMLAAFEAELHRAEAAGQVFDPERVEGALEKLEDDLLELVLLLGQDERVRAIEWTGAGARFEWLDGQGRRFVGDAGQIGLVKQPVPAFGDRQGEPADLEPGTTVVVHWRFGSDVDVTPVALALHLPLGCDLRGFEISHPGRVFRGFVAALRDLRPRKVLKDDQGRVVPRYLEELNPDWLRAFAGGDPITPALVVEAETSRRRFTSGGLTIPKRVRRPNPAWEAAAAEPRGPLFHEAVIARDVLGPTIAATVREIEAAAAVGSADAYPARGPLTRACHSCPFRLRCVRGA